MAEFNYAQKALAATATALEYDYDHLPPEDKPLVFLYALLGMVLGENVTTEHVHDAWALWAIWQGRTQHPCLVPFAELSAEKQALDEPYAAAIRAAAAERRALP